MKTIPFLVFLTSAFPILCASAELVPNGEFQFYKPGEPTVTAEITGGWVPWNGVVPPTNLNIAGGGSANYSDSTTGSTVDLPGWTKVRGNADIFGNGPNGSVAFNAFGSWGGQTRIVSAESLGTVQAGGVYTISVMVGGPDAGPIQGPLAFHLLANGAQLTPTSSVNPTLPNGGAFQKISRTYEGAAIADHVGASLTIVLGVEDDNAIGNRVIFDDVSIEGIGSGGPRIPLIITPTAGSLGNYDFAWESQEGKLYDLVSATDLSTGLKTWPVWDGRKDMIATPPGNSLTDVPGGGDTRRFFAVVEKEPPPLLSEDFEADDGGFTMIDHSGGVGTVWAWGDPDSDGGVAGVAVTTGAGNPPSTKCWGTDITKPGTYATGTNTSLISPVIDLTGVTGAVLSFAQAIDIRSPDALVVNLIEADISSAITPIGAPLHTADDIGTIDEADWKPISGLDLSAGAGRQVRIQWRFSGDGDGTYLGAYIDNVRVERRTP